MSDETTEPEAVDSVSHLALAPLFDLSGSHALIEARLHEDDVTQDIDVGVWVVEDRLQERVVVI